jgi:glycosyltransferase involved in cell wall biosynthesis
MSGSEREPLVSVVLTTRDRPRFLTLALACYRHQTYPRRELIVVDDGDRCPADRRAVEAVGGSLLRVPAGTPLGTKLNLGVEAASGTWCQKMDDDDWYAPEFLTRMIEAVDRHRREVCRPVVAFLSPFLFFHLARWEIRRSTGNNLPGATLLCAREDCLTQPFRPLPQDEDLWFLRDQIDAGAGALLVQALDSFLAVRHQEAAGDREHTWKLQQDGRTLESYLDERPLYRRPEELLPEWALDSYRRLRPQTTSISS